MRVTPPLGGPQLRHPPAWRDRKRTMPAVSADPSVPATTVPVGSLDALDGVDVFELGAEHEQVVFCHDAARASRRSSRSTRRPSAPALGGTRFYPYASTADAVRDVLNLSRGMSYKNALAGLDLGGGKAVIIGDPHDGQDRGAAAGLRPLRAVAERPLHHRLRRRHLLRRHGRRRPRVRLRHRPHRRPRWRRRLVGADGVRRLPGHARERRGGLGRTDAVRAHGRHRRRRQGRAPPGQAPGRRRRAGRRHRREPRGRRGDGHAVRRHRGRRQPTRWCGPRSTSTPRARWVGR